MKTQLALAMGIYFAMPFGTLAQDLRYATNSGAITIIGFNNAPIAINIPETINGYPVTRIGDFAFYRCSSLKSVTIPNIITNIEWRAFSECENLTNINVPGSVEIIGAYAFEGCSSLSNILVSSDNPAYSSLNGVLFDKQQSTLIKFPEARFGDYVVPNTVAILDAHAFAASGVTSILIPSSVTDLLGGVFENCNSLTNIEVAVDNPGFSSVDGVLFDKLQFTLIRFPGALGGNYVIPGTVTDVAESAFSNCDNLMGVVIPSGVINVEANAFEGCVGLTNITIPDSVTYVGDYAFQACTGLVNVTIGNSVTGIGAFTFANCNNLAGMIIGNSVASIDSQAFVGSALTSVIIPGSVTQIEQYAFYACNYLTNFTFLGNAPSLGGNEVLDAAENAVVYYYSGTTGWNATYGGIPTVMLGEAFDVPQIVEGSIGLQLGGFGFTIQGLTNQAVVIEVSTNLVNWLPIQTNTLAAAFFDFVDSTWADYPCRFYRVAYTQETNSPPSAFEPLQITELSGDAGSETNFMVTVPAGKSSLEIAISGGSGDCDLYVRFGAPPTSSTYDFASFLVGNDENVTISNPAAGNWHIMLDGFEVYSGVTLTVQ